MSMGYKSGHTHRFARTPSHDTVSLRVFSAMTTIYLSSTYEDLKEYRRVVFDALSQKRLSGQGDGGLRRSGSAARGQMS